MSGLSRMHCRRCQCETLHVGLRCAVPGCGSVFELSPLKPEKPSARHTIAAHKQSRKAK